MDPADLVIEQVPALLGGPVNTHLGHGLWIAPCTVHSALQPGGEPHTLGQVSHPLQTFSRRHGHDPGDDGYSNSGVLTPLAEVEEVVVIEEELRANIIRSGVDLLLEIVDLGEPVRRAGVAFRKARDADSKLPIERPLRSERDLIKRTKPSAC